MGFLAITNYDTYNSGVLFRRYQYNLDFHSDHSVPYLGSFDIDKARGLSVDYNKNITYISASNRHDSGGKIVQWFSNQRMRTFDSPETGGGPPFLSPLDIAINKGEDLLYVLDDGHRFDVRGSLIDSTDSRDFGPILPEQVTGKVIWHIKKK